jgi:hypothetical protein
MPLSNDGALVQPLPNQQQHLADRTQGVVPMRGLSGAVGIQQGVVQAEQPQRRRGVVDGFIRVCERWGLSRAEQIILLGYAGNELMALNILRNAVLASQDVKDRTGYVLNIAIGLRGLFNDAIGEELRWLRTPHRSLGDKAPLAYMLSGRMVDLITVHRLVLYERTP